MEFDFTFLFHCYHRDILLTHTNESKEKQIIFISKIIVKKIDIFDGLRQLRKLIIKNINQKTLTAPQRLKNRQLVLKMIVLTVKERNYFNEVR